MSYRQIILHLREKCPIFENRVYGAAELAAVDMEGRTTRVPALYLLPLSYEAEDNMSGTGVRQVIEETFGVVILTDNSVDRRGQSGMFEVLDVYRPIINDALLGWSIKPRHKGIVSAGGEHVSMTPALYRFRLDYRRFYTITQDCNGYVEDGVPLAGVEFDPEEFAYNGG